MKGKTSAIIAAAFCAGLFVTVVPGIAPELAAGPAEDSSLVVPDIVTIDKFAAMWAPTAATVQRAAKGRRHSGNRDRKIVRAQRWSYCDPACQRGGREADGTHIVQVITADRSAVKSTPTATISVNRANKGDRLPQESLAKPDPNFSPSTDAAPDLPKRVPFRCDPAFSPAAHPGNAHIDARCMA